MEGREVEMWWAQKPGGGVGKGGGGKKLKFKVRVKQGTFEGQGGGYLVEEAPPPSS